MCRAAAASNRTAKNVSSIAHQGAAVESLAAVLRCLSSEKCSSKLFFVFWGLLAGSGLLTRSELGLLRLALTRRRLPRLSAPGHLPPPAWPRHHEPRWLMPRRSCKTPSAFQQKFAGTHLNGSGEVQHCALMPYMSNEVNSNSGEGGSECNKSQGSPEQACPLYAYSSVNFLPTAHA